MRRYNLPTVNEIAVILPHSGQRPALYDIVLHHRSGKLWHVRHTHPAYVPLYYVLLFPFGNNGWHPDMVRHTLPSGTTKRLSLVKYTAYYLFSRPGVYSLLLRGGSLFQRYLVDTFAVIDQSRLEFLHYNQPALRACLYSGLEDAIEAGEGDVDIASLGQRFILPSSYIGGPRNMQQRFQDAMAIARYFRRVDIFLTVTSNPAWSEITRELLPHQTAYDRPDLVARVFQLKKEAILHDINKNGIFGKAVAYVYTIEFQKRGLPHMHCLIFLQQEYKLSTAAAVDPCIRAFWPDPITEPRLFAVVKQCMVHGPCGTVNPSAACLDPITKECKRRFPKDFVEETVLEDNSFPKYRRPDDGCSFDVHGVPTDNRWIVPYSPYLLATYQCHINVECAVSIGALQYLFKYTHKGGDCASLEEVNNRDEIQNHLDGRYISASEAAHRIFEFEMHENNPTVVRLQVHLPGQHLVVFDENEDPQSILARSSQEKTTLTRFFEMNRLGGPDGDQARACTYQEFPQHFRWDDKVKKWSRRVQNRFALGRMYFVSPTAGERFYLRLLLTVVRGSTSFQDLKTYNGVVQPTFYHACRLRGLLEDDGEWDTCLAEAAQFQTGARLRHLFDTILRFCEPADPQAGALWMRYRPSICSDLRYRLQNLGSWTREGLTDDIVYDYGLYLIDELLAASGQSLLSYPSMPLPQRQWGEYRQNALISDQLDFLPSAEASYHNTHFPLLNRDQRSAYDSIVCSVERQDGRLFFVDGPGGTGKTFLYKVIVSRFCAEGGVIICVASSGIAALLLPLGRTAHSVFKIPIDDLHDQSTCTIPKTGNRADLLRTAKMIVWDEVGPQHRYAIEAFDRTLQDIRSSDRPFGGLTVVFGGDYQQTLPVVVRGSREATVDATLRRSHLWSSISVLRLRENMRLAGDPAAATFGKWLLDVGHGRNSDDNHQLKLEEHMLVGSCDELIKSVYGSISPAMGSPPEPSYFLDRMILAPRNAHVGEINEAILDRMPGETIVYHSSNTIIEEPGADGGFNPFPLTPEYLSSINSSNLPPGELRIKIGCPLILLRNISPAQGLCNGTRVVVVRGGDRVLEVKIIGGDHDGKAAFIPRISVISSSTAYHSFRLRRRQFPVRLAFALSINKAQGQSVKYVGLDLRIPVFSHGQLYVALSRATAMHRVKILLPDRSHPYTTNVVYPEVLVV